MIYSKKIIISIIMIALIITFFMGIEYMLNKQTIEGAANVSNSQNSCTIACESVQNIASIYDTGKMTITDLNVTGSFNLLPKGIIVAWTGTTPPDGWALCDGTNDTPNLNGRFILGLGGKYGIDKTGGSEQMQKHTHTTRLEDIPCTGAAPCVANSTYGFQDKTAFKNRITPYTSDAAGTGNAGNMPPYYVLAYIMKL